MTKIKKIYDNLGNAFLAEDINKIFTQTFTDMFDQFKKIVEEKGIIEDDTQLKQFRSELTYIKRVFKLFSIVDSTKYKEIIDEISIKVNPNKLPKKKKKAKGHKGKAYEKLIDNVVKGLTDDKKQEDIKEPEKVEEITEIKK